MTHTADLAAVPPAATPETTAAPIPSCEFHLGEGSTAAHLGQFPNLRLLTLCVSSKAAMEFEDGVTDFVSPASLALGVLIGDACLKLLRIRPRAANDLQGGEIMSEIGSVIDLMLPLSSYAWATREAFLFRFGEFAHIALHHPCRLTSIIANVDSLTNDRLTERARAIVATGIDPGAADLWQSQTFGKVGAQS